ncbi:hypothetical protein ACET3Z_027326 [Daucus carota]
MISFKQSDLDELRNSSRYLSDVFIEFYFTYLSSIHPSDLILFVPPTISFLLSNFNDKKDVADCVRPLEFHTKDLIFFPVNNGGYHWSLLVYNRELNVFAHHDSLGGLNNEEAQELYLAVRHCVHKKRSYRFKIEFLNKRRLMEDSCVPVFHKAVSPRQSNGYDCGLYVMVMAKAICRWFCSAVREVNWLREIEKIDDGVGVTMRPLVLQLIREASEGRLGAVLCSIEEERRDDKVEELSNDELELCKFWAGFDDSVESGAAIRPSTSCGDDDPLSIAVEKTVADDSPSLMEEETKDGKIALIKGDEAVNDEVPWFSSCGSASEEKDLEKLLDSDKSDSSHCRITAFRREYLTSWPPEEKSTGDK